MAGFNVRLYRDGLQTAWGFRLQGGKDFNQPLTIQRVFTGSPGEGELQRGDVIVAIDNNDTTHLSHKEAQDIIRNSGGQLLLSVKRDPSYSNFNRGGSPVKGPQSPPVMSGGFRSVRPPGSLGGGGPNFGVDYTRGGNYHNAPPQSTYPGHMMDRVQHSLDNAVYNQEEDYDFKPVSELRRSFQETNPGHQSAGHHGAGHHGAGHHGAGHHAPQPAYSSQQSWGQPDLHNQPQSPYYNDPYQHQAPSFQSQQNFSPTRQQPAGRSAYQSPPRHAAGPVRQQVQSSGRRWKPPSNSGFGPPVEFGWTPSKPPHRPGYQPPEPEPEPNLHLTRPVNSGGEYTHRGGGVGVVEEPGVPAWAGSLRSANTGSAWPSGTTAHATMEQAGSPQRSVQRRSQHQAPPNHHHQQQHHQNEHPREFALGEGEDAPHAVNLQYNSPINLYSKSNVKTAATGQFQGQSLKVQGADGKEELDFQKSHVYRMLQEEAAAKQRQQQHAQHHSYQGGHDLAHGHVTLQTNVGVQDPDFGTSDF